MEDPDSDGLLVILAPQGMTDPARGCGALEALLAEHEKTAACELDGRKGVAEGEAILNAAEFLRLPIRTLRLARSIICGATAITFVGCTKLPGSGSSRKQASQLVAKWKRF